MCVVNKIKTLRSATPLLPSPLPSPPMFSSLIGPQKKRPRAPLWTQRAPAGLKKKKKHGRAGGMETYLACARVWGAHVSVCACVIDAHMRLQPAALAQPSLYAETFTPIAHGEQGASMDTLSPPGSLYARRCTFFMALKAALKRSDAQKPVFTAPKTAVFRGSWRAR